MTATITLHHGNFPDVPAGMPDRPVDGSSQTRRTGWRTPSPARRLHHRPWVNGDRDYIPEGTGFMGKAWDAFVPPVAVWN